MYHIPNGARAQRPSERICESLMTFQNTGTLSDISVTQIAAGAGVGRSAFCRLFDNSYDVLYWKSEEIMERTLHRASGMNSFDDIFLTFIAEWMEHQSLLQTSFRFSMTDHGFMGERKHWKTRFSATGRNGNIGNIKKTFLLTKDGNGISLKTKKPFPKSD